MQTQQTGMGHRPGQQNFGALSEQDQFQNILVLLKHTASEYASAVTESNCAVVRQTMQRLLHETLTEQADCFQMMSRHGWYTIAPQASRQDVQKEVLSHRQTAQQTAQMLQGMGSLPIQQQNQQTHWQNPLAQPAWQNQQQAQSHQWQQPNQMIPNDAAHIANYDTNQWRTANTGIRHPQELNH